MLNFTSDEKKVIIFFIATLAVGSGILVYKRTHPRFAPGLQESLSGLPVPRDTTVESDSGGPAARTVAVKPSFLQQPVNLNTADQKRLELLPFVGPAMARRIIDYRKSAGGFKTVGELSKVRGIGPKRMAQLKGLVTVGH